MNKQNFLMAFLAFLIVVLFILFLAKDENREIKNYPASSGVIVAFGDSLVEGVGSKDGGGFVSILSEKIGEKIINEGRSGDTTMSAMQRVDNVLAEKPRMVFLLLGGNDYLRQIPKEKTFENLGIMIERFQEDGAVVVLLGVRGGALKDNYEEGYKEISEKYGTLYVPNILSGLLGKTEYMHDQIHPNDEGYKIIADRIYGVVQGYIK